jgi:hypothetical protein
MLWPLPAHALLSQLASGQPGIAVAIASLQNSAVFVSDTLDNFAAGLNIETAGFPNSDTSSMNSGLLARWNRGDHIIPCAKTLNRLSSVGWVASFRNPTFFHIV